MKMTAFFVGRLTDSTEGINADSEVSEAEDAKR